MMTSYWPAVVISFLLHFVVILLVVQNWQRLPEPSPVKSPTYIKASLIDIKTRVNQKVETPKPEAQKIDLQKKLREQERLKKLAEQEALKKRRLIAQAEKAKQEQLAEEQRKEQERQAREKERAEQEKKEQERKQREREQALQQQARLEQQLLEDNLKREIERLAAEERAEALARQLENDQLLAQSYSALIQKKVQQNWSRPPSARRSMEALLTIQLIPTGEVIDVAVTETSGSQAFDRSAVRAVKKVGRFTELQDMPTRIFEKDFRRFQLIFKPQDLRQ